MKKPCEFQEINNNHIVFGYSNYYIHRHKAVLAVIYVNVELITHGYF